MKILLLALSLSAAQFKAGAAVSDITPWLGISMNGLMQNRHASEIHDPLYARALVLDDGQTRLAIVVSDSCMIPREVFDAAKRIVEQQTGIPATHMLMSATHTHSAASAASIFQSDADEQYQRFLAVRISESVVKALENLAPARIGWGVGKVPDQVFNRRWRMKPGTIPPNPFGGTDLVKMNPPAGSVDLIGPAGPTDPDLSVVSVQSQDGKPIALLANYSLHYVGGTGQGQISADYFGVFACRMGELLGADKLNPPFVGMLSNGTSGDINNIDFRRPRERQEPYMRIHQVVEAVAQEAVRVCQTLTYQSWVPLKIVEEEIELAVRLPSEKDVDRARDIMAKAKGPAMQTPEEIYARETVLLSKYPEKLRLVLQALRIGDLGIVAIPCEVFVEIGLEIKQKSPFKPTFTIELANGYNGYLPTVEQHQRGGYETWRARSSYLEVEAAPKIVQKLLEMLATFARYSWVSGSSTTSAERMAFLQAAK